MDDPNTVQPAADPNTQPGGQSYENIVQLQTRTAQTNNELTAQLQAAQAQIASLSTPPTQSSPTPNGDAGSVELFDFREGLMRTEDGAINPQLLSTFKKIGIDSELAGNFVGHMENSVKYNQFQASSAISETVGSQENFEAVTGWAKENMPSDAYSQIMGGMQNLPTMKYALQDLMNKAVEGGFTPPNAPQVTPQSNEPTTLPANTGGTTSTTPLMPGTAESRAAVTDPRFKLGVDDAFRQQTLKRLEAGVASQQQS